MRFKKVCWYKRCMRLPVTAEQLHRFITLVSDATAEQFEL